MTRRWLLLAALVLAGFLHQDSWNWTALSWVGGLPVGFAYHLGFCLVVATLMALLVRSDGPSDDSESR